jgi:hypothetical protein
MLVHRAWIAGLGTALSLGLASGDAEPAAEPPSESSIYAGSVSLDGSRDDVEVVGIGWGTRFHATDREITEGIVALGVRTRPLARLWVESGAGGALDDDARLMPGAMMGAGLDLTLAGLPLEVAMHAGTGIDDTGSACAYHGSIGVGAKF